jgi:hypothetical protein
MADRDISAFGLFPDRASLERAVNLLRGAGFRNSDVSMLTQETPGTKDLAHEAHTRVAFARDIFSCPCIATTQSG